MAERFAIGKKRVTGGKKVLRRGGGVANLRKAVEEFGEKSIPSRGYPRGEVACQQGRESRLKKLRD